MKQLVQIPLNLAYIFFTILVLICIVLIFFAWKSSMTYGILALILSILLIVSYIVLFFPIMPENQSLSSKQPSASSKNIVQDITNNTEKEYKVSILNHKFCTTGAELCERDLYILAKQDELLLITNEDSDDTYKLQSTLWDNTLHITGDQKIGTKLDTGEYHIVLIQNDEELPTTLYLEVKAN